MDVNLVEIRSGSKLISFIENDKIIGETLMAGIEWEGWMRNDAAAVYKPGTDILDIGGNIGCTALMFSDIGPVHTFEPLFHFMSSKCSKVR